MLTTNCNTPKILSEMTNEDWKHCVETVYYKIGHTYEKLGRDELMSAANVGVSVATTKFDPKKCPKALIQYLIRKGYYCAIDQIRTDWKARQTLEKDKHSPYNEIACAYGPQENDNNKDFFDIDPPLVEDTNNPNAIVFNDIIKDLPEWKQNILRAHFVDGVTQQQIGDNFICYAGPSFVRQKCHTKDSLTESAISLLIKRIIDSLRKIIILKNSSGDIPFDINESKIKKIYKEMVTSELTKKPDHLHLSHLQKNLYRILNQSQYRHQGDVIQK
jgi:RNA polymerase sigma factor (sigma-70 family)